VTGTGCVLTLVPLAAVPFTFGGSGHGNGAASFGLTVPAGLSGLTLRVQAFVADPIKPDGVAASDGLRIEMP